MKPKTKYEYKILSAWEPLELEEKVQYHMNGEGEWRLVGGLSTAIGPDGDPEDRWADWTVWYYQAIARTLVIDDV